MSVREREYSNKGSEEERGKKKEEKESRLIFVRRIRRRRRQEVQGSSPHFPLKYPHPPQLLISVLHVSLHRSLAHCFHSRYFCPSSPSNWPVTLPSNFHQGPGIHYRSQTMVWSSIQGLIDRTIKHATENPSSFIWSVLLLLSPFFLISAFLSWKLAKQLQGSEKKRRAKQRHVENIKATLDHESKKSQNTRNKRD